MSKQRKKNRENKERQEQMKQRQIINCASKVAFHTKHAAEDTAKRLRKLFNTPQEVYHCPICGKYHLTNSEEKR